MIACISTFFNFYASVTFEAKKLPLPLWIPQKNRVATAYLSSANGNLSRQNKAELGMQGGLSYCTIKSLIELSDFINIVNNLKQISELAEGKLPINLFY